ncbi:M23 family metallopeptidase, partial [Caldimonas manganoxidans]|uniref:M23 family metallopeptidase n=1 Tax=Caldimonas manganoxidans TaxID=196015 RepID=UPI00036AF26A
MLISPPFLPEPGSLSEQDWLEAAMPECEHGVFPVSYRLGWHGGRHLQAPRQDGHTPEYVRAIADGQVIFTRPPSQHSALNYAGGYTSDGVVVICHDTEIGADAQNQPTIVRFYSVYMHLHRIEPTVQQGRRLYRKDVIGQAGHILGQPHCFQLDICLDDDNVRRLVGRLHGTLPLDQEGRTDALYGDAYVYLPPGTAVYERLPDQPTQRPMTHSPEAWFIGLNYTQGALSVTTYAEDGRVLGRLAAQREAEYGLYEQALQLAKQYQAAPAACYELLRWARVLGPHPVPAQLPHWQRIATPHGPGWVNLRAPGTRAYSDADFPHWRGWTLVDDSADGDSRCDSPTIWRMLDADGDGRLSMQEAQGRLAQAEVRQRLARTICKFASEWDASTLQARWGWLRQPSPQHPPGMSDEDWQRFCAHAQALCFECPQLFQAQWHVDPKAFIGHMRRCGWRSEQELVQLVPSHAMRTTKRDRQRVVLWEEVADVKTTRNRRPILPLHRIALNKMLRIYGIDTPLRQACFFGNSIQETGWLQRLSELQGESLWYAPWYGRGFLQLTGPGNYCEYWRWRGRQVPQDLQRALTQAYEATYRLPGPQRSNERLKDAHFPQLTQEMVRWRVQIESGDRSIPEPEENRWAPSDSAGFYWLKTGMARYADEAHEVQRQVVWT